MKVIGLIGGQIKMIKSILKKSIFRSIAPNRTLRLRTFLIYLSLCVNL